MSYSTVVLPRQSVQFGPTMPRARMYVRRQAGRQAGRQVDTEQIQL